MNGLGGMALTLAVGTASGLLAHRVRFPGGALLGALLGAAALHLLIPELTTLPSGLRVVAQILIGIVIGAGMHRAPFRTMAQVVKPLIVAVVGILGAAAIAGFVLYRFTDLPLASALLAVVPGGASDVTAAALELEQDAAIVAGFQLVRQLTIFGVVIGLFQFFFRHPPEPDLDGPELDT